MPRPGETEEERAKRKERERRERENETDEERAKRKERERRERDRPKETEEERAKRKERERREREGETEEERAKRKERERRERDRPKETEEERAKRKEREREERHRSDRPKETEEERAKRKERERRERENETEEERAKRKEREREERHRSDRPKETDEERAARKERERRERGKETEEERKERKDRERREREDKEAKRAAQPVVHKALPTALGASSNPGASQNREPVAEKPVMAAPPKQIQAAPPKAEGDEEEGDGYGDDDFEEEFSPEELAAMNAALAKENAAVKAEEKKGASTTGSSSSPARGKYDVDPSMQGKARDGFDMNSLQRQKAKQQYEKDMKRADALRRLVDLDSLAATVLDLPPQTEYDLFIRNFGGIVRQQTAVQAPAEEDKIDVEAQAERIHSKIKGCQCPEDLGLFPERKRNETAEPVEGQANGEDKDGEAKPVAKKTGVDTAALGAFLTRSFPVIRSLMDENEQSRNPLTRRSSFSNHSFSSTVLPLLYEPCNGRPVVDVAFSRNATQYMMVVYGPPSSGVQDAASGLAAYQGVALLWNVNDNREPDKILVSHSALTTGSLSASRPYLAYAGTENGAVCVWDTREPDHIHADNSGTKGISARLPSYASEWGKDNHQSSVVKVCISGYNSIMGVKKEETEQLVSIDKKGHIFFWRVNDEDSNKRQQQNNISDTEYGLNLFSSIQLHRVASLSTGSSAASFDLEFVPSDTSHVVVATSKHLEHISKFGSIAAPSSYKAQSTWGSSSPACSVHFSPTDSRVLVGGFRDGNVRLFLKDDPSPQVTVPIGNGKELSRVRFSTSMKWVVFALDVAGTLSVIDFAGINKTTPVATSDLQEAKAGRCTSFDVSMEEKAETRLGIGYANGLVEVHTLNSKIFGEPGRRNDRWL